MAKCKAVKYLHSGNRRLKYYLTISTELSLDRPRSGLHHNSGGYQGPYKWHRPQKVSMYLLITRLKLAERCENELWERSKEKQEVWGGKVLIVFDSSDNYLLYKQAGESESPAHLRLRDGKLRQYPGFVAGVRSLNLCPSFKHSFTFFLSRDGSRLLLKVLACSSQPSISSRAQASAAKLKSSKSQCSMTQSSHTRGKLPNQEIEVIMFLVAYRDTTWLHEPSFSNVSAVFKPMFGSRFSRLPCTA